MVEHNELLLSHLVLQLVAAQKWSTTTVSLAQTKSNQSCWCMVISFRRILHGKIYYTENRSL